MTRIHGLILEAIFSVKESFDKELKQINSRLDSHNENFTQINSRLDSHNENFKQIKTELKSLGNTVTRIEYSIGEKAQIGLEYTSIAMQKFDALQKATVEINSKLNNHDLHIEVLEEKVL